jgi:hypothetical protein
MMNRHREMNHEESKFKARRRACFGLEKRCKKTIFINFQKVSEKLSGSGLGVRLNLYGGCGWVDVSFA